MSVVNPHRHQVKVPRPERPFLSAQAKGLGKMAKCDASLKGSFDWINRETNGPYRAGVNSAAVSQAFGLG
jgi:hypothetical protein